MLTSRGKHMRSRGTMHQSKKRRYIIAASVAVPIIIVALYSAAKSDPYPNSKVLNFDSLKENTGMSCGAFCVTPPVPNFAFTDTGGPQEKGSWIVKSDETSPSKPNVLARLSSNQTGSGYHLAIASEGAYSNFDASVKFKIISGEQQRAAGLIVRFQDVNHYFVLMADAMNHKFSLCRAQTGFEGLVCTQDKDVNITIGQWHSIRAEVAAQGIAGSLDNVRLLQRNDQNYLSGGPIGLWTKGDSNVYFDDLKVLY
jgi:hypothetical protein